MTARSELAGFERLIKMIEHELQLAGEGRVVELEAAVRARSSFIQTLPAPAPAAAHGLVLRAQALHSRTIIETQRLAEAIEMRRDARRVARRMASVYAAVPMPQRISTSA